MKSARNICLALGLLLIAINIIGVYAAKEILIMWKETDWPDSLYVGLALNIANIAGIMLLIVAFVLNKRLRGKKQQSYMQVADEIGRAD